jgi:hypothetical protein
MFDPLMKIDRPYLASLLQYGGKPFEPNALQRHVLGKEECTLDVIRRIGKSLALASYAVAEALFQPEQDVVVLIPSLLQGGEIISYVDELLETDWVVPYQRFSTDRPYPCRGFNNGSRIRFLSQEKHAHGFTPTTLLVDEPCQIEDATWVKVLRKLAGKRIELGSSPLMEEIFQEITRS